MIIEQTLAGDYFVILNKRTGQSGTLVSTLTSYKSCVGQSLHRQLGVSRRKGVEVRQRMSGAFTTTTDTSEQNGGLFTAVCSM